ncbi:hypothetical protein [Streptomyces avermitilis]|uniref:hypothetical protein n=1 Tax=Streptomyces avermitilis TaxID=33903 RepID=UPI0033A3688D
MIEKGGRETNLVAGLLNLLTGERAAVGEGVQAALNVPGREELQKPPVPGVADGRQFLGEPPLEQQQLPVSGGQNTALHEQVAQVGDRSPGVELAQAVVRERNLFQGESAQVVLGVGLIGPGQGAPRAADLPQSVEQRE